MLKINQLTIQYHQQKPSVEQFDLNVKAGEIVGIVGESGSGKTTMLHSIIGALPSGCRVISGDICYRGNSLLRMSDNELRKLRGTKISMVFQDCRATLNPIRKIGTQYAEYIRQHSSLSKKAAWNQAAEMLKKMQLPAPENIMNSYPHQLSGGMCQRVGIAMAMTFEPDLLLADEPTSALDVTTQAQIVKELMDLRERFDTAIIIVTHNLGLVYYMADSLTVMQAGKIVEQGINHEVIKNPSSEYTKMLLQAVPG